MTDAKTIERIREDLSTRQWEISGRDTRMLLRHAESLLTALDEATLRAVKAEQDLDFERDCKEANRHNGQCLHDEMTKQRERAVKAEAELAGLRERLGELAAEWERDCTVQDPSEPWDWRGECSVQLRCIVESGLVDVTAEFRAQVPGMASDTAMLRYVARKVERGESSEHYAMRLRELAERLLKQAT